jgi:hypothetical protein
MKRKYRKTATDISVDKLQEFLSSNIKKRHLLLFNQLSNKAYFAKKFDDSGIILPYSKRIEIYKRIAAEELNRFAVDIGLIVQ